MNEVYHNLALAVLLTILAMAAYVDRVYSEMGKFLAREYQDNIDAWTHTVEPKLHLGRESIALSASVLRQLSLATIALIAGLRLYVDVKSMPQLAHAPSVEEIAVTGFFLVLLILFFDRLIPQLLFARTKGLWIAHIRLALEALFYLILPVTLTLGLPKSRSIRRRRWTRCWRRARKRAFWRRAIANWCGLRWSLATRWCAR